MAKKVIEVSECRVEVWDDGDWRARRAGFKDAKDTIAFAANLLLAGKYEAARVVEITRLTVRGK